MAKAILSAIYGVKSIALLSFEKLCQNFVEVKRFIRLITKIAEVYGW